MLKTLLALLIFLQVGLAAKPKKKPNWNTVKKAATKKGGKKGGKKKGKGKRKDQRGKWKRKKDKGGGEAGEATAAEDALEPSGAADESGPGAGRTRVPVVNPPVVTAPNLIEVSDFSEGWCPDLEASAVPMNGLLDAVNVLPEIGSGTVQTRAGFKRLANGVLAQGYRIEAIHPYSKLSGGSWLICVATTGQNNVSDNVRIYAYNLGTDTAAQISPTLTWPSGDGRHYGIVVGDTFYGGGPAKAMYSWNGTTFSQTPATPSYPVWGAQPKSQADYAFERGNEVLFTDPVFGQRAYSADKDIRFSEWESTETYERKDKVSIKRNIGGVDTWRSYQCRKEHDAGAANRPGDGTGDWQTYWKTVKLQAPADAEGRVSKDWNLIPTAPKTNLGVWHGERMWLRADDIGPAVTAFQRLLFSPPGKPRAGSDVSQLHWAPNDWRIGDLKGEKDEEADGGGWEDFRTGDGDEITALRSYGYHLLVFKRKSTFVVAGLNRRTWTKRLLASVGAIGKTAVCEHEGLVYFFGDEGLFFTDGTSVREVAGFEKVRTWLRDSVNWDGTPQVTMWSFGGYIWIALPTDKGLIPNRVLVYDPNTESFWPQDLQVQAACVTRKGGVDQLFFSQPAQVGAYASTPPVWTGDPDRSQSTRAGVTNLFSDPSFEAAPLVSEPRRPDEWESIPEAVTSSPWQATAGALFQKTVAAARDRGLGAEVVNPLAPGGTFEGIFETFADTSTGTHTIAGYFRVPGARHVWETMAQDIRFFVGSPSSPIPVVNHEYARVSDSNGWWRISATYTGSLTPRPHGFVVQPEMTIHADAMLCHVGGTLTDYFDGERSNPPEGHQPLPHQAILFQYEHPDVQEAPADDAATAVLSWKPIQWFARSAWFTFGILREERRIRKVWTMVRGVPAVLLRGFRNYREATQFEVESVPSPQDPVTYHEGRVMPDGYSAGLKVEGLGAPAALLGMAVETQPRRVRYHT